MSGHIPPGWPEQVHPPGGERFADTALAWLLELVPPEYRRYGVLRRYPLTLARLARQHVEANVQAAREGFRTARADLAGKVPPHGIEALLETYRTEGARLAALAEAVRLVEDALLAEAFPGDPERRHRSAPRP
ncbi:hypothetical protein [Thermomonospora cellulosilytica]|uniref:Uncharacterized protein n=1 Tax=Thermomonospora cellulosilytica TaxID=1411118 RepID=A0A7W3R8N4_9ACTN|nr:hypothetical protein [Thermomonospora cellulosilytica]MBA9004513.1 hypothetical protein [Thermomonospora cellulosilytica]